MRDALKRQSRYGVYVVQRADGTYYTGSTNNLERRLKLHTAGHGAKYLRGKGPFKLGYAKDYRYYKRALSAERQFKKFTRKQKEELVHVYQAQRQRT